MDNISNFQFIWKEWVTPLVSDLYAQMDEEFKRVCKVKIRDLNEICAKAEGYYQKKREEVKKSFYGEYHKGDSVKEHRMDFHKIGAIICRTLIEYKVFQYDVELCEEYVKNNTNPCDTDWVVRNALINFRLAFYGSVVFLFQSMLFEYHENDVELYNGLIKKGKLNLYETPKRKDAEENEERVKESFENCLVLDLAKRDIGNRSFDYFMYAIILYQLEEHNKGLLRQEQ